jgi:hypothetical protein
MDKMKRIRHTIFRSALVALCALTGVLLAGSAPALAASPFTSSFSFGKTGPTGGLLEEPRGVAVQASSGDAFVVSGANANELQSVVLSGAPTGGSFTLSFKGQTTTKLAYASNEKQTVTLSGATSGSFMLEFRGQLSATIPFHASAAEVQSALEALPTIKSGNVSVSGAAGGPYTVEFKGALGSEHAGELLCHGEGLNAGATCTPATVVNGNESAGTGEVQSALEALSTIGAGNVEVRGEENNYLVEFRGSFANTNVEQMACAGSGPTCTVATSVNGLNTRRVVKYNAAGTVALGEISGAGTPQKGFEAPAFGAGPSVAVDNSTTATKGDVYVTSKKVVDRFKPKGSSGNEPNEYVYECQMSGTGSGCTAAKNEAPGEEHGGVVVDSSGNVFYGKLSSVDELEAGASEVKALKEEFLNSQTPEGLAIAGNELYVILSPFTEERELAKLTLNAAHNAVEGEEEGIAANSGEHAVSTDAAGNVYVLEEESAGKSHVAVYAPNPTSASTPSEQFGTGEIGEAWGIAYSTQGKGRVYVSEKANDAVHVFDSFAVAKYETCAKLTLAQKIVVKYKSESLSHKITEKSKAVYDGKYTAAGCLTKAASPGAWDKESLSPLPNKYDLSYEGPEGKYELEAAKTPIAFTSKGKGGTFTVEGKAVKCKADTNKGKILSPDSIEEKITFTGCETSAKVKCTTTGAAAGTVETETLEGLLVPLPGEVKIGERLSKTGGDFAVFACGAETFKVEGELIGTIENTTKGEKITFAVVAGKQEDSSDEIKGVKKLNIHLYTHGEGGPEATLATIDEQTGPGAF